MKTGSGAQKEASLKVTDEVPRLVLISAAKNLIRRCAPPSHGRGRLWNAFSSLGVMPAS